MTKSGSRPPAQAPQTSRPEDADAPQWRSAALSHRKPTRFHWRPDAATRKALARDLDLIAVESLSLQGEITPEGRADFRMEAMLEARVTQACVITLAPVPGVIREPVLRRFLSEWKDPEGEEAEMPEDDSAEPMPEVIDLAVIGEEALSLALPPYPRAAGAELGESLHSESGTTPLRDEDLRPFAGLASLMKKSDKPDSEPDPQPEEKG